MSCTWCLNRLSQLSWLRIAVLHQVTINSLLTICPHNPISENPLWIFMVHCSFTLGISRNFRLKLIFLLSWMDVWCIARYLCGASIRHDFLPLLGAWPSNDFLKLVRIPCSCSGSTFVSETESVKVYWHLWF